MLHMIVVYVCVCVKLSKDGKEATLTNLFLVALTTLSLTHINCLAITWWH